MADEQANVVIIGDDGTRHVFPPGFDPKRAAQIVKQGASAPPTASTSNLDRLTSLLPTAGGMVGGMAGGIPGAALGGAAGEGYGQLASHLTELPGAVADVASNLIHQPAATLSGAAQGVGQGLKDSGLSAATQALYELGGKAVSAGLSAGGRAIYRGYLKPSLSANMIGRAGDIVETGIREGIPVTEGGAARAEQLITDLRGEVDRILKATPGDVNLSDVADRVREFARRKYYVPGKPLADYEAAMKVADELDKHPSLQNPFAPQTPATATLSKANEIKRGIDDSVGESNFGIDRGATKTAQKVERSTVRQAIEAKAPAVGPINARESKLIDLANALEKATGRESNRNALFGVPALAAGASGVAELAAGAGRYGAGAMALATRMGLTPAVATRAAILAAKMGDQLPGTAVADVARIAVQTISQSQQ